MGFITALAFTFVNRQRMRNCDREEIVKYGNMVREGLKTHIQEYYVFRLFQIQNLTVIFF